MLPVIQSRALDFALVEREAEWFDEMQRRAGREAGASRVTGIPVDFGVNENDVNSQRGLCLT